MTEAPELTVGYRPLLVAGYVCGLPTYVIGVYLWFEWMADYTYDPSPNTSKMAVALALLTLIWVVAVVGVLWFRDDGMPHTALVLGVLAAAAVFSMLAWPAVLTTGSGVWHLYAFAIAPAISPPTASIVSGWLRDRQLHRERL